MNHESGSVWQRSGGFCVTVEKSLEKVLGHPGGSCRFVMKKRDIFPEYLENAFIIACLGFCVTLFYV